MDDGDYVSAAAAVAAESDGTNKAQHDATKNNANHQLQATPSTNKVASSSPHPPPASAAVSTSPVASSSPPSATRMPFDEASAATKIQASFRGHQARHRVTRLRNPHLWPSVGPLSAMGKHPPKRTLKNPIFATLTNGKNRTWGCPGEGEHPAIYFDLTFSPHLEGVYLPEQWAALAKELNTVLRTSHLPPCPSGLLFLFPLFGACGWYCWREKLHTRRDSGLSSILSVENARLAEWGLKFILIPVYSGGRPGRGDVSGFVLELVMTHAKRTTAPAPVESPVESIAANGASGPKRQAMEEEPTNQQSTGATPNHAGASTTGATGEPKITTRVVDVKPIPESR